MAVLILPSLTSLPIDLLSRRTLNLKHLPSRNYLYFSSSSPLHHFSPKPHLSLRRSPITFFNAQKIFALRSLSASTSFQFEFSKQQPWPQSLLRVFASVLLIFGLNFSFAARVCYASSIQFPPLLATHSSVVPEEQTTQDDHDGTKSEGWKNIEEKKLYAAFETWKSKTYALTVPLTVVALRGSIPPSWVKDFIQSQGRRSRFQLKLNGSLEGIFSELSVALGKGNVRSSSVVAADLVSIGDSWLNYAIKKAIIQPIEGVEDQDWFRSLSNKWKVYLCRNSEGNIDPDGKMWAAPYRWGCMVIAYKKSKFQKYNLAPIEDWADLWQPELTGRISMVESPREVVGAVLKYMGASYNTNDICSQVSGGKDSVQQNLALLAKQVRLFDDTQYLKAFGVGDVWVAVGWSSDVLPVAKRMSNVAVVVPKSGASLWADLWVIPAASRLKTNQIGGRVRGPSPLIHQWIEFCLQAARSIPFKQEVIPGSSPSALESAPVEVPRERNKGKPRLDTNLVEGVPPTDILAKCEFLEPLSDSSLSDYQWLISGIKKSDHGLVYKLHCYISSLIQNFRLKLHPKLT